MWFRRDLRAYDNAALYRALTHCDQVWCVFVFDTDILEPLPRADRRVEFIVESLKDLDIQLQQLGRTHERRVHLLVRTGHAVTEIDRLAQALHVQAVFTNHDDEPAALQRDAQTRGALAHHGVMLHTFKDHVVLERSEVLTQSGQPYTVFTPYKNAWLKRVDDFQLKAYPIERHAHRLADVPLDVLRPIPSVQDLGFQRTNLSQLRLQAGTTGAKAALADFAQRISHYGQARDFPALKGPSYLSVHLRFGTLSIREAAQLAWLQHLAGVAGATTWLNELIWRDFYHQLLSHYPHVVERSFKPAYDAIRWEHGKHAHHLFAAWCEGRTGYPLVDAAMHQLNQTGYMHNRLRMVTASFLCKDLGLDWRWGERYFAEKLNDFDLAANNGGWQWASSSGCDAQPYFRIINPIAQSEKFDPDGRFIKRYLPHLAALSAKSIHAPWLASPLELLQADVRLGDNQPHPLVDHAEARTQTLTRYVVVKSTT
jgi:deoxyribodipyrimidine photo-lyase